MKKILKLLVRLLDILNRLRNSKNDYYNSIKIDISATHPNRYWWQNKMKFLTLWEACKIIRSDLYLLSYSEDINEDLHLMKVLDLNENGIKHDIGFKIKYNVFIEWLKEMEKGIINDIDYLTLHSNGWRERDELFWAEEEYWKSELKKF